MCRIQSGESVLITADSSTDYKPVMDVAKAAEALGAKVMVPTTPYQRGMGKSRILTYPSPYFR